MFDEQPDGDPHGECAAEIARLTAENEALRKHGPPMQRGTTIEGTPRMGTVREVLEAAAKAFEAEVDTWDEMKKRGYSGAIRRKGANAIRALEFHHE